ncbi:LPXTG cell wall anchor domain-containing protein, partial [Melissococcus plutonius]
DGIKAIDDQHKPGDPVDNRKEQAKADIDKEAKKVKDEIDTDEIRAIDDQHKPGNSVDNRKEKVKIYKNNNFKKNDNQKIFNNMKIKNSKQFPNTGEENNVKFFVLGIFFVFVSFLGVLKLYK